MTSYNHIVVTVNLPLRSSNVNTINSLKSKVWNRQGTVAALWVIRLILPKLFVLESKDFLPVYLRIEDNGQDSSHSSLGVIEIPLPAS